MKAAKEHHPEKRESFSPTRAMTDGVTKSVRKDSPLTTAEAT